MDGVGDSYRRVRGIDTFDNIPKIIKALKDETTITIDFTISPYNTKQDLIDVARFSDENGVRMVVGVYDQPDFLETKTKPKKAYEFADVKCDSFHSLPGWIPFPIKTNNDYIMLYNKWISRELELPCYSIRASLSVMPNGDVSLCQGKNIIVGNLKVSSLSEIWNSEKTKKVQKGMQRCNGCFLTCQRPVDVFIGKSFLRWLVR